MSFHYPRHRILEIVQAPKTVSEGQQLTVKDEGVNSARFDVPVDLVDGPFADLRYLGSAGRKSEPHSYDASFLLEQRRVRGVGYCAVARQNFRAKLRIPEGWHQNICDPNVPTDHPDSNRHEPLPGFTPTDFVDFIQKCANPWKIDLQWEERLL